MLFRSLPPSPTLAAEGSFDPGELDRFVQGLLLLAVVAEGDDAVQLLVVFTAHLAAELVHLVLHTATHPSRHHAASSTAHAGTRSLAEEGLCLGVKWSVDLPPTPGSLASG